MSNTSEDTVVFGSEEVTDSYMYSEVSSLLLSKYDFISESTPEDATALKRALVSSSSVVTNDGSNYSRYCVYPYSAARSIVNSFTGYDVNDMRDLTNPNCYKTLVDVYIDLLSCSNGNYNASDIQDLKDRVLTTLSNNDDYKDEEQMAVFSSMLEELASYTQKGSSDLASIEFVDNELSADNTNSYLNGEIDDTDDLTRNRFNGTQNIGLAHVIDMYLPPDDEMVFLALTPSWATSSNGMTYSIPLTDLNSLSVSTGANFKSETILGRSAAYFAYSNSTARVFTFNLKIPEEICLYYTGLTIVQLGDFLLSLTYPEYSSFVIRTPLVEFSIGRIYPLMRGIIQQTDVVYSGPYRDRLPTVLDTSFSIQEITDVSHSALEIAGFDNVRQQIL